MAIDGLDQNFMTVVMRRREGGEEEQEKEEQEKEEKEKEEKEKEEKEEGRGWWPYWTIKKVSSTPGNSQRSQRKCDGAILSNIVSVI
jgi:hypothetical protein